MLLPPASAPFLSALPLPLFFLFPALRPGTASPHPTDAASGQQHPWFSPFPQLPLPRSPCPPFSSLFYPTIFVMAEERKPTSPTSGPVPLQRGTLPPSNSPTAPAFPILPAHHAVLLAGKACLRCRKRKMVCLLACFLKRHSSRPSSSGATGRSPPVLSASAQRRATSANMTTARARQEPRSCENTSPVSRCASASSRTQSSPHPP